MGPGDEWTRALKLPQLEGKTTPKPPFLRCRGDVTEKTAQEEVLLQLLLKPACRKYPGMCQRGSGEGWKCSLGWWGSGLRLSSQPAPPSHLEKHRANTGDSKRRWKRVLVHGRCAVGTSMGMAVLEGWAGWATVWAKGGLGRCGVISLAGWVLIVRNGFYWAWNLD